ncbi:hypothetical protein H072_8355 [Dactylellina haptotyla CBS 200.50]|uniref:Uncharacterized protein n=1 Tax=Dactylellina haptotyla (strain CBS 200.50) TaxID=1284197 RepID=S8A4H6_DACHA|nr:hypothetical protein H072_8355 [Dactylellina haptotyla CBS 200.50]
MDEIELTTPFVPIRRENPEVFFHAVDHLETSTMVECYEKCVLQGIAMSTTNLDLLKIIPNLDPPQLRELAQLSMIALKNLRNWSGRPSSAINSPNASSTTTPTGARPAGTSPSFMSAVISRLRVLRESRESSEDDSTGLSGPFPLPLGTYIPKNSSRLQLSAFAKSLRHRKASCIIQRLGITREDPRLPSKVRRDTDYTDYTKVCELREQERCLITGETAVGDEIAPIFPFPILQDDNPGYQHTWRFIVILLGENMRDTLVKLLVDEFWGGAHTCEWNALSKSPPFYLDVRCNRHLTADQTLPFVKYPADPNEQFIFDSEEGHQRNFTDESRSLNDGDTIRIASPDDETPLPSETLLFWNVYVWRILGAVALTGPYGPEFATPAESKKALAKMRASLKRKLSEDWYERRRSRKWFDGLLPHKGYEGGDRMWEGESGGDSDIGDG